MKRWKRHSLVAALFFVGIFAEGATVGSISGSIQTRPSVAANGTDTFHTENAASLGVQVSESVNINYSQLFITNLSGHRKGKTGISPYAHDGYLRASLPALYKSADESLTLSYAPRAYLPTYKVRRDAGMITAVRNYVTLKKKLNETLTVSGSLIPIFHVYSRPGSGANANPAFENRVYAIADVTIVKGLTFSLPILFHQTRYRSYQAGAKNNNAWSLFLWTYPELLYAVTENFTVGMGYYTNNLLKPEAFTKGVGQMVFKASL